MNGIHSSWCNQFKVSYCSLSVFFWILLYFSSPKMLSVQYWPRLSHFLFLSLEMLPFENFCFCHLFLKSNYSPTINKKKLTLCKTVKARSGNWIWQWMMFVANVKGSLTCWALQKISSSMFCFFLCWLFLQLINTIQSTAIKDFPSNVVCNW